MSNFFKLGAAAVLACALGLGTAQAQTQARVDASKDWSVFQAGAGGKKICWIASKPTVWVASRGGKTVQVNRGDIYLMVSIRPADGVSHEVYFRGGYPFKSGSKVQVKVGSDSFSMFTEGENAWPLSPSDDSKFVEAFKRGADAKIEGVSTRGTKTVDTFSLSGFTAALASAEKHCQ